MKGENILLAMGSIDDRYIMEAEEAVSFRISGYAKGLIAACVSLLILAGSILPRHLNMAEDHFQVQDTVSFSNENETVYLDPHLHTDPDYIISQDTASAVGEVPSVILRVEEWTETGFVGTVAELVDTDIFDLGTRLLVEFDSDTFTMRSDHFDAVQKTDPRAEGMLVRVMFTEYDADARTLVIESLEPEVDKEDEP